MIDGRRYDPLAVVDVLAPFVSEERKSRIEVVVANRTRSIVPVIEGVHDLGNIGAVIRSAEGLGFLELHVVDRGDTLKKTRRTSQGAEKWIDVVKWTDAGACARQFRDRGYRVVVTHVEDGTSIEALDFSNPIALVFGNEADGVSSEMLELADDRCFIPMYGFAQSFNVSVAAAIALYHARAVRSGGGSDMGLLTEPERLELRARYYARSVQHASRILKRMTSKDG